MSKQLSITQTTAPQIYNLFPRLLGPASTWGSHLPRIIAMGFNWVYVNPLGFPGFSGSLYSIKDPFRLNPMFAVDEKDQLSWDSVKKFISEAHNKGLKFMIDLVINHTAIDAIDQHPGWYAEKFALIEKATENIIRFFEDDEDPVINEYPPSEFYLQKRIANPFAIDPADARKITIWGDLAEINYKDPKPNIKSEILAYWKRLFDHYLTLGTDGFRCDAAYKSPPWLWQELIEYCKAKNPSLLFFAETLGCTLKECEIVSKHFDYIANSSKYWDFTKPWAVEQYNSFRVYAPSVSFPESHDTLRLAFETRKRDDVQKFRYLFAAFFSAGVLMPLGYEYGFQKRMDVVDGKPADWEEPTFNISEFIGNVNALKTDVRCLNEDGPITHLYYADLAILLLRKASLHGTEQLLLIYNKDWQNYHHVYLPDLKKHLALESPISRLEVAGYLKAKSAGSVQEPVKDLIFNRDLFPNEYILLWQH